MDWEQIQSTLIAAVAAFFSGGLGATVVSYLVSWLKTRKIDKAIIKLDNTDIAARVVKNIEGTQIKLAIDGAITKLVDDLKKDGEETYRKLETLEEVLIACVTVNAVIASLYERSDKLSLPQKTELLNAMSSLDKYAGRAAEKRAPREERVIAVPATLSATPSPEAPAENKPANKRKRVI